MKEYKKIMILTGILLLIIALITVLMIVTINLGLFKNLSIAEIQKKKQSVDEIVLKEGKEEATLASSKTALETAKIDYEKAKEEYKNIDESTIAIVQEATTDEKYFIEYLWVVLGNYAKTNSLDINIITPGSTVTTGSTETTESTTTTNATTTKTADTTTNGTKTITTGTETTNNNPSVSDGSIKIIVKGRYSNVADFVFDVENDKELKFKLDNIKMTYAQDNKIEATFDILKLAVNK